MRLEGEPKGEREQASYMDNAAMLMEACWSRRASLGPGNPGHVGIEAGVTCYGSSCRIN